mmetsp:Transcript_13989/g.44796  ORF Transcript_13989/g.44796 Transcript_13989/m.44796 type:complete len:374 (-) Transcript_13989:342-1463(-)
MRDGAKSRGGLVRRERRLDGARNELVVRRHWAMIVVVSVGVSFGIAFLKTHYAREPAHDRRHDSVQPEAGAEGGPEGGNQALVEGLQRSTLLARRNVGKHDEKAPEREQRGDAVVVVRQEPDHEEWKRHDREHYPQHEVDGRDTVRPIGEDCVRLMRGRNSQQIPSFNAVDIRDGGRRRVVHQRHGEPAVHLDPVRSRIQRRPAHDAKLVQRHLVGVRCDLRRGRPVQGDGPTGLPRERLCVDDLGRRAPDPHDQHGDCPIEEVPVPLVADAKLVYERTPPVRHEPRQVKPCDATVMKGRLVLGQLDGVLEPVQGPFDRYKSLEALPMGLELSQQDVVILVLVDGADDHLRPLRVQIFALRALCHRALCHRAL